MPKHLMERMLKQDFSQIAQAESGIIRRNVPRSRDIPATSKTLVSVPDTLQTNQTRRQLQQAAGEAGEQEDR